MSNYRDSSDSENESSKRLRSKRADEDEDIRVPDFKGKVKTKKVKDAVKTSLKKVENSGPYLVLNASLGEDDTCQLYDLDDQKFLLVSEEPIEVQLSNSDIVSKTKTKFETPDGDFTGYCFYKNNFFHIKFLDDTFSNGEQNWRNNLLRKFTEPKEKKEPILLWEGDYEGRSASLYEYSEKCLAFITPKNTDLSDKRMNVRIGQDTLTGYYIPKVNAKQKLKDIVPSGYASKYKMSEPEKSVSSNNEPVLIKKLVANVKTKNDDDEVEILEIKIKLYDYSEKAFMFVQPLDEDEEYTDFSVYGFTKTKIKGKTSFTFPKADTKLCKKFKKLTDFEPIAAPRSEHAEELSQLIPKAEQKENVQVLIMKLISEVTKMNTLNRYEFGNKIVFCGPESELSEHESEIEECSLFFEGKFEDSDKCIKIYKK